MKKLNWKKKRKQSAIQVGKALHTKHVELKENIVNLNKATELKQNEIQELAELKEQKQKKIQDLTKHYLKIETDMNKKIERLKDYMTEKSVFLKTFEFIEEDDLNDFLSKSETVT